MINALPLTRRFVFMVAIAGVTVAASGQCFAQSAAVYSPPQTRDIVEQQLAVQQQTLKVLQTLQGEIASLARSEQGRPGSAPTAAPLSLAGCPANGNVFPKGAQIAFTTNQTEECVDAVRGKPAYGLSWHLIPASSAK